LNQKSDTLQFMLLIQ